MAKSQKMLDKPRRALLTHKDRLGTNLKALSLECGLNPTYFQQYISRHSPQRLPDHVRRRLAKALDCSPEEFLPEDEFVQIVAETGNSDKNTPHLSVEMNQHRAEWIGVVMAGVFIEADTYPHEDIEVQVGKHEFDGYPLFAATIRGPSMNRVAPEGFLAVFVDAMAVLNGYPMSAIHKKCVIVRHSDGLGKFEYTMKRAHHLGGQDFRLVAESYDPKWDGKEINMALNGHDDQEYSIIGIVVSVFNPAP